LHSNSVKKRFQAIWLWYPFMKIQMVYTSTVLSTILVIWTERESNVAGRTYIDIVQSMTRCAALVVCISLKRVPIMTEPQLDLMIQLPGAVINIML